LAYGPGKILMEKLAPIHFLDNRVLQQRIECLPFGDATFGSSEEITVYGTWNNEKVTQRAFSRGLAFYNCRTSQKLGAPISVMVEGHEKLEFWKNVYGEGLVGSDKQYEWTPKKTDWKNVEKR